MENPNHPVLLRYGNKIYKKEIKFSLLLSTKYAISVAMHIWAEKAT